MRTARGTVVARVRYEASAALAQAGLRASEIAAWWTAQGGLNGAGIYCSPLDVLRNESFKEAAQLILATTGRRVHVKPLVWPVRSLVLLDVDGVLSPINKDAQPLPESMTPLDFWQPPLARRKHFSYDPEVLGLQALGQKAWFRSLLAQVLGTTSVRAACSRIELAGVPSRR